MARRRRRDDDGNGGEAGQEEEEGMRAYYDSQAPIARGEFVKKVKFCGQLVDYYNFVGLETQAGARAARADDGNPQSGRRNRRRARGGAPPATAGQQNENGASSAAAVAGGGEGVVGNIAMAASAAVGGGGGQGRLIIRDQNNVAGAPSASHEVQAAAAAADAGGGGGGDMEEGEVGDRPIMPVAAAAVGPAGAAGDGDRWVIRKKLTQSDVNGSSRLLLLNEEVVKHVLKYIDESEISKEGKEVRVWDEDEHVEYTMRLARWNSSGSYVFKDGWKCRIVETRKLKKDDTVGFYWDPIMSRFVFSVLEVAAPPGQQASSSLSLDGGPKTIL